MEQQQNGPELKISDEAIEAAAAGIASANMRQEWADLSDGVRETYRADARSALGAAAPHITAPFAAALKAERLRVDTLLAIQRKPGKAG